MFNLNMNDQTTLNDSVNSTDNTLHNQNFKVFSEFDEPIKKLTIMNYMNPIEIELYLTKKMHLFDTAPKSLTM